MPVLIDRGGGNTQETEISSLISLFKNISAGGHGNPFIYTKFP